MIPDSLLLSLGISYSSDAYQEELKVKAYIFLFNFQDILVNLVAIILALQVVWLKKEFWRTDREMQQLISFSVLLPVWAWVYDLFINVADMKYDIRKVLQAFSVLIRFLQIVTIFHLQLGF